MSEIKTCFYCGRVEPHIFGCPHDSDRGRLAWLEGYEAGLAGKPNPRANEPAYNMGYVTGECASLDIACGIPVTSIPEDMTDPPAAKPKLVSIARLAFSIQERELARRESDDF